MRATFSLLLGGLAPEACQRSLHKPAVQTPAEARGWFCVFH